MKEGSRCATNATKEGYVWGHLQRLFPLSSVLSLVFSVILYRRQAQYVTLSWRHPLPLDRFWLRTLQGWRIFFSCLLGLAIGLGGIAVKEYEKAGEQRKKGGKKETRWLTSRCVWLLFCVSSISFLCSCFVSVHSLYRYCPVCCLYTCTVKLLISSFSVPLSRCCWWRWRWIIFFSRNSRRSASDWNRQMRGGCWRETFSRVLILGPFFVMCHTSEGHRRQTSGRPY